MESSVSTWEGRRGDSWALSPRLSPQAPVPYLLCTTMAALGSPVVPDV